MATLEKMTEKLKSLEKRLELIGHVPSQKEDRVLYARIKYYYTKYPNNPQVKHLIEKYPFPIPRKGKYSSIDNIHKQIQYFEDKLKVLGRVPTSTEDYSLLYNLEYCYRKFNYLPEVKRLMTLYPTNSLYSKWGPEVDPKSCKTHVILAFYNTKTVEDPYIRAMRYIKSCLEKYNELPGLRTWPMHFAFENMRGTYRNKVSTKILDFAQKLIAQNLIQDECFIRRYYSSCLDQPFLRNRIDEILKKHLIVTIGYLAKKLVPGIILDLDSIYNYFYYQEEMYYPHNGIQDINRHRYRIFTNKEIISVNFDKLASLDFQAIAQKIPYNILPEYDIQFNDEEDLCYAKSFLFHHDEITNIEKINGKTKLVTYSKIDFSKTIFDDIKAGLCPFYILNKDPFWDDITLTIDWCYLLVNLESTILKEYIGTNYFNILITRIQSNELTSDYKVKILKIKKYLWDKYEFQL